MSEPRRFKRFTLDSLGLSRRASNAIARSGISNMDELFNWDADEILKLRGIGTDTFQEMLQACLKLFIRPPWMMRVSRAIERSTILERPDGYMCFAQFFESEEAWVRECLIADLERGRIEWVLVKKMGEKRSSIWRKGGIEIEDEE